MATFLDRLFGREPARKATLGGAVLGTYQTGIPLYALGADWNSRAKSYLAAYKVGWFYKAGSRISRDFANLPWTLAFEDGEGDNEEEITAPPSNVDWQALDPLEQFLRLWEQPNPWQTGRALKQQAQIRLDFTGRALVYMENGEGGGMPTALFGISPERMWPSYDSSGRRIGWVLDKDQPSGGVPFTEDEIIAIEYPGTGIDPMGVVEAVYANVPLTKQLPQHTSDVLATGGRLAGMAWPKNRALSEDEFNDAQRAWRNVTSDPNAARRLLLFPEPMEYQAGASSPTEIGIPELSELNREEILTAFPIHPYMVGVPLAAGLNSGESLRYVRNEYWEGTQHPRVELWEDALQMQLLPRYEKAVGRPLDFDIEEPDLDDAPTIVEKVGAFRGLVAVGFDPKEAVAAAGLDHIKWNGLPTTLDPNAAPEPTAQPNANAGLTAQVNDTSNRDASVVRQDVVSKTVKSREDLFGEAVPGLRSALEGFLREQRERVIERLGEVLPASKAQRMKALPDDWWDAAAEDGLLLDRLRTFYVTVGRGALQVVTNQTDRVLASKTVDRLLSEMLGRAGLRITDINETTRKTIAATLDEGVRRGYSITQLTRGVAEEGYGGVQGALMANGVNVWDDYRAEMIARTETMNAYNQSAILGYKEHGVRQLEAIDGDYDDTCALRNGQVYSADDALNVDEHPNGTLDWAPLTN